MASIIDAINEIKSTLDTMPPEKKLAALDTTLELIKKIFNEIGILQEIAQRYESELLPEITAQLHAAEKRTEKGIDQILSACEALPKDVSGADDAIKKSVQGRINSIFEASNFQDLSAQHLNEVKLRLDEVGSAMKLMSDILTGDPADIEKRIERYRRGGRPDAHLLNGPGTDIV